MCTQNTALPQQIIKFTQGILSLFLLCEDEIKDSLAPEILMHLYKTVAYMNNTPIEFSQSILRSLSCISQYLEWQAIIDNENETITDFQLIVYTVSIIRAHTRTEALAIIDQDIHNLFKIIDQNIEEQLGGTILHDALYTQLMRVDSLLSVNVPLEVIYYALQMDNIYTEDSTDHSILTTILSNASNVSTLELLMEQFCAVPGMILSLLTVLCGDAGPITPGPQIPGGHGGPPSLGGVNLEHNQNEDGPFAFYPANASDHDHNLHHM